MRRTTRFDPCLRDAACRDRCRPADRIRVVEILATGTNGGAQEHLFGLLTRIDRTRYDVSVVSLSPGSAVRKLQRAGFDVLVIDEPDDAIAVGALAAPPRRRPARRHPQPHVPGRDRSGRRRRSPSARSATGGRTSCRPSTRAGSARTRIVDTCAT